MDSTTGTTTQATTIGWRRRGIAAAGLAAAVLALGGCVTGPQTVSATVQSWGSWPAGRAPGTFAFERLPSQQGQPQAQQALEDAARPALAAAGFREVTGSAAPDVLVQVGARVDHASGSPWADPAWYPGFGYGAWRYSPWRGPRWGIGFAYPYPSTPRYDREAALLLRDRASGQPVYETRASNEGYSSLGAGLASVLFRAALKDFPAAASSPRNVDIVVSPM